MSLPCISACHGLLPKPTSSSPRPLTLPTKSSRASVSNPACDAAQPAILGSIRIPPGEDARLEDDDNVGESAGAEVLGGEEEAFVGGDEDEKAGATNARVNACRIDGREVPRSGYAPCRTVPPPNIEPRTGIGDIGVGAGAWDPEPVGEVGVTPSFKNVVRIDESDRPLGLRVRSSSDSGKFGLLVSSSSSES